MWKQRLPLAYTLRKLDELANEDDSERIVEINRLHPFNQTIVTPFARRLTGMNTIMTNRTRLELARYIGIHWQIVHEEEGGRNSK